MCPMSLHGRPKNLLVRGLLAGAVMFACGAAFHALVPALAPSIQAEYENTPVFREWAGPTRTYMVLHPFGYGLVFASAYELTRRDATGTLSGGAVFGGLVFLVGALPIYLLMFASLRVPAAVVACWAIQGSAQYAAAGAALGSRSPGPAPEE
jgi:hypothetical protein